MSDSEPPVPKKRKGIGLTVAQKDMLIDAASGPWCIALFLEMAAGLGAPRGEVLALRWSDIMDGRALIARSLTQTKQVLEFKGTKTDETLVAKIPEETLPKLEAHRKRQDEFRVQFGPDYRSDLDLIFANPDGSPLRPDSISATVSALFKRLKIPKPKGGSLHLLRHTLASQMLDSGVPLPVVSPTVPCGCGDQREALKHASAERHRLRSNVPKLDPHTVPRNNYNRGRGGRSRPSSH